MKKALRTFFVVIGVLFFASCAITCAGGMSLIKEREKSLDEASILFLKLDGVIYDGEEDALFLENLKKYSENKLIKGVLIQMNSPGGVVGPSQEIYSAIKRIREKLKKPVVVSGNGLVASGAYYAAVAADKIVANPGTMMGSIGVILQFANLEKLYSWAKIKRYSITSGKFKDAGADYRELRPDERKLFQDMIDEVHMQFQTAVAEGRGLDMEKVKMYADGRVFTGETAVRLGFADQLGSLEEARALVGKLTDLGDQPRLFEPPKKRPNFFEILEDLEAKTGLSGLKNDLHLNLVGRPLFMLPGAF